MTLRPLLPALLAAAAIAGTGAASAGATTVSSHDGALVLDGGPGVTVVENDDFFVVKDPASLIVPGPGCIGVPAHEVTCTRVGVSEVHAFLGAAGGGLAGDPTSSSWGWSRPR